MFDLFVELHDYHMRWMQKCLKVHQEMAHLASNAVLPPPLNVLFNMMEDATVNTATSVLNMFTILPEKRD